MRSRRPIAVLCSVMMMTVGVIASRNQSPQPEKTALPDITSMVPEQFGEWQKVPLTEIVLPPETAALVDTETVYRAYRDNTGRVVTLVIAYSETDADSLRLHIPESCYVAQGFIISGKQTVVLEISGRNVAGVFMSAERGVYREAVSYWLRDGADFVTAPYQMQFALFRNGYAQRGKVLVRASTSYAVSPPFELLEEFLIDFDTALEPEVKAFFLGSA